MLSEQVNVLDETIHNVWNKNFPDISLDNFQKIMTNNLNIKEFSVMCYGQNSHHTFAVDHECDTNNHRTEPQTIKSIEFELYPNSKFCKMKNVSLYENAQGKGIFPQFMYNLTEVLKIMDIKNITNNRTINYSFRTQSKLGILHDSKFNFDDTCTWEECVSEIKGRFKKLLSKNKIIFSDKTEKDNITDLINEKLPLNKKAVWLIADLKNELTTGFQLTADKEQGLEFEHKKKPDLGTYLLFNLHVLGHYDLKDPDVTERMNNYFNAKQVKKIPELEGALKL